MKIALWGKGKTGGEVLNYHPKEDIIGPFGKEKLPSLEELDSADVILLFIPGAVLDEHMEILLKTSTPIVSGTTGIDFSDEFKETIRAHKKIWVQANNFSIMMMTLKKVLNYIGKMSRFISEADWKITESHHTAKLDSPSGTAISWKNWTGLEVPIESIREGDIVGIHDLEINDHLEKINIKHESLDRSLFAKGALKACKICLEMNLEKKFYYYEDIIDFKLNKDTV